jgi:hypothetical protein
MSTLETAQELAKHGLRVFPLLEGSKLPRDKQWPAWAKTDAEGIRRGWTNFLTGEEQNWNIGIAAGAFADGRPLAVLDVDIKDGARGAETLAQLERLNRPLPATWTARTATGGRHHYFAMPFAVRNSASKLGEGLDVRGEGGYVVAPGSRVEAGN